MILLEFPLYYQGTAVLIYQSKIWRHGIGSIKKLTFVLSLDWFYRKCSWQITILDILGPKFYRDGSMLTIESNIEVFFLTRSSPVHAIVWFYSQIWGFGFGWLDLSRLSEGFWKRRSRKPLQQQRWLFNYLFGGSQKIEWQWPHWKVECRSAQVIVIQFFWAFEWIKWQWHPLNKWLLLNK